MASIIDQLRSPYGLSGGTLISGSVTLKTDAFWYYPVSASSATIVFGNIVNTSGGAASASINFAAGQGIYGNITQVTQSAGIAILYSGSYLPGTIGQ